MATVFYCRRFSAGEAAIRTRLGIVRFHDGRAEVHDPDLAAALRDVSPVFQIEEEAPAEGAARPRATRTRRKTPKET